MTAVFTLVASVLTVSLPSSERAEVSVAGFPADDAESVVSAAAVRSENGLEVLDFRPAAGAGGLVRNLFADAAARFPEDSARRFREMSLVSGADPLALFLRDSVRTFGPAYLPSRVCRCVRDGKPELGTLVVRADALYGESYLNGVEADWDVLLDGKVVAGEDAAWKELVRIATDEGFGPARADNWLRLQGCNDTGTTNLEYPVLIDSRSLMVCALACDFCEANPDVYAYRTRVQPGMGRSGFLFLVGEKAVRDGRPTPLEIHRLLLEDGAYRRGFADLVHEACVRPGGEFSAESCARRIDRRIAEVRAACGSDLDAGPVVARFEALKARLSERSRSYVGDCSFAKLLRVPAPLAVDGSGKPLPAYGRYRGKVGLTVKPGAGKVYYSENGCDPWDENGEVSPLATEYTAPFEINGRCRLFARTLTADGEWSALEMVNLNLQ